MDRRGFLAALAAAGLLPGALRRRLTAPATPPVADGTIVLTFVRDEYGRIASVRREPLRAGEDLRPGPVYIRDGKVWSAPISGHMRRVEPRDGLGGPYGPRA